MYACMYACIYVCIYARIYAYMRLGIQRYALLGEVRLLGVLEYTKNMIKGGVTNSQLQTLDVAAPRHTLCSVQRAAMR